MQYARLNDPEKKDGIDVYASISRQVLAWPVGIVHWIVCADDVGLAEVFHCLDPNVFVPSHPATDYIRLGTNRMIAHCRKHGLI